MPGKSKQNRLSTPASQYLPRVVSGIQPTTDLHLGHFFGALSQHVRLQHEYPGDSFFVIADYHALTRPNDPTALRNATLQVTAAYLAFGLNPNKAVIFRQSDVPQLLELFWILSCIAPTTHLATVPTYKSQPPKGHGRTAGLLTYPVLMAADILGLRATIVPVGSDQGPSIERVRDIAKRFGTAYATDLLPIPVPRTSAAPVVRGTDGRKMSALYSNTIGPFDSFATLRDKVNRIVTSPGGRKDPKDPETCTVYHLLSLVVDKETALRIAAQYRDGTITYQEAKRHLTNSLQEYFADAQEEFTRLQQLPDFLEDVLREGFRHAADEIRLTTEAARELVGL